MVALSELEWQVLNAMSDDVENLEQVYRSLSLEFSSENYDARDPSAFYWREAGNAPLLADIADTILSLASKGLLEGRIGQDDIFTVIKDKCAVWMAWFRPSEKGRQALASWPQRVKY